MTAMAQTVDAYKKPLGVALGNMSISEATSALTLSDHVQALRLSCAKVRKISGTAPTVGTQRKKISAGVPLPPKTGPVSTPEEQAHMFSELEAVFQQAEDVEGGVGIGELRPRIDFGDQDEESPGRKTIEALNNVRSILDQMWQSDSRFIPRAAEIMADASRESEWRIPFGESGILDWFAAVVSTDGIGSELLLPALRLVGNSCADRDLNRERIVSKETIPAIVNYFENPLIAKVAVPVTYNICVDYEPAQVQAIKSGTVPALMRIFSGPRESLLSDLMLLSYSCRLLDLVLVLPESLDTSPDNSIDVLCELISDSEIELDEFSLLATSLVAHLKNERFQKNIVRDVALELPLSVLVDSYQRFDEPGTPLPPIQTLELSPSALGEPNVPPADSSVSQIQKELVQAFSDISALEEFPTSYPVTSPLTRSLMLWLSLGQKELQLCACIMLGNLARSDSVCRVLVEEVTIHEPVIAILASSNDTQLLHASTSFLKNLSLPLTNKPILGAADLIPISSRLWALDTLAQLQLAAVSLTRQLVTSTYENVQRILVSLSPDPDSPAHNRTYLSILLSLYERSDQLPVRTEIARVVTAILRVFNSDTPEANVPATTELRHKFYTLHHSLAFPLTTMVTQTQWPVVRSEGWFALALMSRTEDGAAVINETFDGVNFLRTLAETIAGGRPAPETVDPEGNRVERNEAQEREMNSKDRDNALVCVSELLRHTGSSMPAARQQMFRDLLQGSSSRVE